MTGTLTPLLANLLVIGSFMTFAIVLARRLLSG